MCLDELYFEIEELGEIVCLDTTHLVPVFILETLNQMNYKCLPKFVQTDNES